jgi:hypothetical protein
MHFRKSTSILLAILILFSNLGLAFTVHYCEDKIASISLNTTLSEPCDEDLTSCCAPQLSHDTCCSNKVIKAQEKKDIFLSIPSEIDFHNDYVIHHVVLHIIQENIVVSKKEDVSFYCDSNAPPFYKLYCQLVLYA